MGRRELALKENMRVAIIGLGVIGGSLGMALLAKGNYEVVGIDRDPVTVRLALETGAVSAGTTDCLNGVKQADIVVLAIPVGDLADLAREIAPSISSEAIVTDVGSTKEEVVALLEEIFPSRFVGGHPMTGSERSGIEGAELYLFENAIYVLTPTARTDSEALQKIQEMVADSGAISCFISPDDHDRIVAAISHLPHMMAVALMNLAADFSETHPQALTLAAGGFRDMTRIAASSQVMWRDIFATNRRNVIELTRHFREVLLHCEQLLEREDYNELVLFMQRACCERQKIPFHLKGTLPTLYELICTVPDRPGSIALITGLLGEEEINISDLEILRIREGEGGTIRLGFKTEREVERAFQVLCKADIAVKRRR
jgi:prephenate dehydrogenase